VDQNKEGLTGASLMKQTTPVFAQQGEKRHNALPHGGGGSSRRKTI